MYFLAAAAAGKTQHGVQNSIQLQPEWPQWPAGTIAYDKWIQKWWWARVIVLKTITNDRSIQTTTKAVPCVTDFFNSQTLKWFELVSHGPLPTYWAQLRSIKWALQPNHLTHPIQLYRLGCVRAFLIKAKITPLVCDDILQYNLDVSNLNDWTSFSILPVSRGKKIFKWHLPDMHVLFHRRGRRMNSTYFSHTPVQISFFSPSIHFVHSLCGQRHISIKSLQLPRQSFNHLHFLDYFALNRTVVFSPASTTTKHKAPEISGEDSTFGSSRFRHGGIFQREK